MNTRSLIKEILPAGIVLRLRSMVARRRKSLSQLGQDFWVFGEAFSGMKNGFYVDVGSADGILYSNTFLLEKRFGWKGICIEANPAFFRDLMRVRRAVCLNICIDAGEGLVNFVADGVFGGIVAEDTDTSKEQIRGREVLSLPSKSLLSVLESANAPRAIDYLSVDVEGAEERVLLHFPFDRYIFKCMTVERPKKALRDHLLANGYHEVKEIPHHDVFYVHESFRDMYEKNVFRFWGYHSVGRINASSSDQKEG